MILHFPYIVILPYAIALVHNSLLVDIPQPATNSKLYLGYVFFVSKNLFSSQGDDIQELLTNMLREIITLPDAALSKTISDDALIIDLETSYYLGGMGILETGSLSFPIGRRPNVVIFAKVYRCCNPNHVVNEIRIVERASWKAFFTNIFSKFLISIAPFDAKDIKTLYGRALLKLLNHLKSIE